LNKELTVARLHRLLTVAAKHGKDSALKTYLDVVAGANFQTLQEALVMGKIDQCLQELGFVDKWRAEGRVEGKVEMIIHILSRRLELPSMSIQNKISSIQNIAKLDELADLALTCVSLDEFLTALE
jgi:hypothetical protein